MKVTTTREKYDAAAKGEPHFVRRKGRKIAGAGLRPPVREGGIVTLRFKDGGKTRGRLALIVVAMQPIDDGRWLIRLERVGTKHRPIPADDTNLFLARKAGYTGSASQSLDPDAPTVDLDEARRVMRDTQVKAGDGAPSEIAAQIRKARPVDDIKETNPERVAELEERFSEIFPSESDDELAA